LSLVAFNIGIELGQLLVLLITAPFLVWLARTQHQRVIGIIVSAWVAHTAWHWMGERYELLRNVNWPEVPTIAPGAIAAIIVFVAAVASLLWLVRSGRLSNK
jgi:HupE / UreJ protein